jgi:Kef-type K+ transport system membrane component KefB
MDNKGLETLLAVTVVAALAPTVIALLPRPRPPQVVVLIFSGIIIGPAVLGLGDTHSIRLLANVGLGFLFLLAGYELDPALLRQHAGKLAIGGWLISALLAIAAVGGLASVGFVRDYVPIGLALTTTALGTLLPILKDNELLAGPFGRYVLAAGAAGELLPILVISLFLTNRGEFSALISILTVCVVGLLLALAPRVFGKERLKTLVAQGQRTTTGQTTLRWSIVLLLVLLVIAADFGLDVVLGALVAGIVLRHVSRWIGIDMTPLEHGLDAVGYGLFIPIFFVSSGMTLDVAAIARNPLRMLVFLALLLAVRGLPALIIYRRVLPARQRVEMTFITATTMPLLIALAEIGLSDHVMIPANAAALVGAGVLSVLIYPLVAISVAKKGRRESSAGLSCLPQTGDALPDPDAHRGRCLAATAPRQLVQQRGGDPGSRAAERVADRDRAAVHVNQLRVALELVDHGDGLGGERLVDLEQRQLVDLPARSGQGLGHRRDRTDAHVVRVHSGGRARHVPGQRLRAGGGHRLLGHQQQAGGAVVERRGVAAGDGATRPEGGLLGGQFFESQVRLDSLVFGDRPGRGFDRHDLGVEPARLRSRRRVLVARERELVLPLPVDTVLVGDVLRGLAEADRRVQLGHPGTDQPPAQPGVDQARLTRERLGGPWQHERRTGHRLGPAGDADVGVAGRDRPGRRADRLHAGAAQAVHRGTGHLHRQAG